jgi:hypothetical protein
MSITVLPIALNAAIAGIALPGGAKEQAAVAASTASRMLTSARKN